MRSVVAIPARNEAERIGACLSALAGQGAEIVLLVNDTTDATAAIARLMIQTMPEPIHVIEHAFGPERACAGAARRMAMERAAALAGPGGVLLTTDADGCVPPDWVAAKMVAIAAGAEAVAGRAMLHPADAALIPAALHADDARECAYAAALDALAATLDPDPADPAPRHWEESGASIAVTVDAWLRAGGMPATALAEDRRFFDALRRVDARVRHAPEIAVTVSGRIAGRAAGGMADTIRRRLARPDPFLDDALEPAVARARRLRLRARFRAAYRTRAGDAGLARALELAEPEVRAALAAPHAGRGWAALEAASPALVRRLVPAGDVERELTTAAALLRSQHREAMVALTPR